ncbi:MAG: hypothetical protein ACI9W2_002637 [Gammaproteobacteria bacterium]|jgi:hypothetical protein
MPACERAKRLLELSSCGRTKAVFLTAKRENHSSKVFIFSFVIYHATGCFTVPIGPSVPEK